MHMVKIMPKIRLVQALIKLVQWDKGQQLIVKANPEYYGKKPYFKKITFCIFK